MEIYFSLKFISGTVVIGILLLVVIQLVSLIFGRLSKFVVLKWKLREFPGRKPHWFWGNVRDFTDVNDLLRVNRETAMEFKYYHKVQTVFGFIVRLIHPEYVKVITNTTEPKGLTYNTIKPWIGDGLITANGSKWHRNRRLLTPAFHFDILKRYTACINLSAHKLIKNWKTECQTAAKSADVTSAEAVHNGAAGGDTCSGTSDNTVSMEMFTTISVMTLDSLLKCVFSYKESLQETSHDSENVKLTAGSRYISDVNIISRLISERNRALPIFMNDFIYFNSPNGRLFRKVCDSAHKFTGDLISERKETRANNLQQKNKKDFDFMDILLEAKDEDGQGLSAQEIQDEVDAFVFAGHDTTASGISWLLYNLARFPEHQDRCREEVVEILDGRSDIKWEDISRLEYLTMCVKESLRIHPPAPNIARRLTRDIVLPDGKVLPEGMSVIISPYAIHHNPHVWPDPEHYDPSRFSPENSTGRSSHAFIPFSAGPRNCIGQNFALTELKVVVGLLLTKFKFEVDKNHPTPIEWPELILRSRSGVWLNVTPL